MDSEFLFSNLPIGLVVVDKDTYLVDANGFIFENFNQPPEDVKGKKFGNAFHCEVVKGTSKVCGECSECSYCDLRNGVLAVIEKGATISDATLSHKFHLGGRSTTKWFTVNATKVLKEDEEVVLIALTDVTEIKQKEKELVLLGITDSLTGLFNRRHTLNKLEDIFQQKDESQFPLSFAMLDIDHFKNVNDTYGHPTGDKVIMKLASILQKHTRSTDLVCRYGGEEFLILFANTDTHIARDIIARISEAFGTHIDRIEQKLTLSAGIYTAKQEDMDTAPTVFIEKADQLLYKAKNNGRNRIETEL